MVAFSVPIWSPSVALAPADEAESDTRDSVGQTHVVGVLAMTVQLGDFAVLPDDTAAGKISVLVDSKPVDSIPGEELRKGCVLEHPFLARSAHAGDEPPECYLDSSLVEDIERLRELRLKEGPLSKEDMAQSRAVAVHSEYRDPLEKVEPRYARRWLAAIEPVFVNGRMNADPNDVRDARAKDTGWAIIIQEPYDTAVAQIEELRDTLKRLAAHSIISWEVFNTDSGDRDAQFATLADIQFGVSTTSTMDLYVDAVLGNDGNTGSSSSLFRRTQLL